METHGGVQMEKHVSTDSKVFLLVGTPRDVQYELGSSQQMEVS